MGFFDGLSSLMKNKSIELYEKQTGKKYNREYRNYKNDYEYKSDNQVLDAWEDIVDKKYVDLFPKRMAIRDTLIERGLDFDDC